MSIRVNAAKFAQLQAKAALPATLDALFMSMPVPDRARFAPQKAALKLALEQGDMATAEAIIAQTEVPEALSSLKTEMLACFENLLAEEGS